MQKAFVKNIRQLRLKKKRVANRVEPAELNHQTEGAAKANIICFGIATSICNSWGFFIDKPGELSLGPVIAVESLTVPVGVGGNTDDTGLVESD